MVAPTTNVARPVSVLLVDDKPFFIEAAREVFAAMDEFAVVGEAGSGERRLRRSSSCIPIWC